MRLHHHRSIMRSASSPGCLCLALVLLLHCSSSVEARSHGQRELSSRLDSKMELKFSNDTEHGVVGSQETEKHLNVTNFDELDDITNRSNWDHVVELPEKEKVDSLQQKSTFQHIETEDSKPNVMVSEQYDRNKSASQEIEIMGLASTEIDSYLLLNGGIQKILAANQPFDHQSKAGTRTIADGRAKRASEDQMSSLHPVAPPESVARFTSRRSSSVLPSMREYYSHGSWHSETPRPPIRPSTNPTTAPPSPTSTKPPTTKPPTTIPNTQGSTKPLIFYFYINA